MSKKLEKIFDECIERLLQGETIDDCLKSYPQLADKLEPLLKTAVDISWKATHIEPRPVFKSMTRARVQGAFIYAQQQKQQPKQSSFFSLQRAWVPALSIVLVLILGSAGTVAASSVALPDETLYPVKEAAENARLALTFTDAGKAKLYVHLAEIRSQEIAEMAIQGKADIIVEVTEKLTDHLEKADEAIKRVEASKIAQIQKPKPITVVPAATESGKETTEEPSQQEAASEKPSAATAEVKTGEGKVSEEPSQQEAASEKPSATTANVTTKEGKVPEKPSPQEAASEKPSTAAADVKTGEGKVTEETSQAGLKPDKSTAEETTPEIKKVKVPEAELLRKKLKDSLSNNLQILQDALDKTPEKSRVALIKAIETSNKTREQIQREIGGNDNGDAGSSDNRNKTPDGNNISDNTKSPRKQSETDQFPSDNTSSRNRQLYPANSSTDNKTSTRNPQSNKQTHGDDPVNKKVDSVINKLSPENTGLISGNDNQSDSDD